MKLNNLNRRDFVKYAGIAKDLRERLITWNKVTPRLEGINYKPWA